MSKVAERYPRFDRAQRIEHGLLVLSFTILSISGLPQKYPDTGWGQWMIWLMGGIETTRFIHHTAAIVLILAACRRKGMEGFWATAGHDRIEDLQSLPQTHT